MPSTQFSHSAGAGMTSGDAHRQSHALLYDQESRARDSPAHSYRSLDHRATGLIDCSSSNI